MRSSARSGSLVVAFAAGFAAFVVAGHARADRSTIKSDTDHPSYFFEAEPHLTLSPFHGGGIGAGFEGTFNIVDQGFIKRVNDSVGVGFGVDWTNNNHWLLSAAMQWNFWLSENWSVFGAPGFGVRLLDDNVNFWPNFGAGGRFHFTPNFTLTMRLGFPVSAVGVSFLF
jgi:hypothetical protein